MTETDSTDPPSLDPPGTDEDGHEDGPKDSPKDSHEDSGAPARGEALNPGFVRKVIDVLDEDDRAGLRGLVHPLHPADIADLIELLRPREQEAFFMAMGQTLDPEVLPELEQEVRDAVVRFLDDRVLVEAVRELETDDAIYLLQALDEIRRAEILALVPQKDRAAVEMGLAYPEYSAGRIMQRDFVAVPPFWTVGQVQKRLQRRDIPERFFEIFVIDESGHPVGTVLISRLMRAETDRLVSDVMATEQTLISVTMEQEEVAYQFDQYHLISAAVVDEDGRLVGMITIDDVVDVIQEEHEEDILRLGGVEAEGPSDTVLRTVRSRFPWLFINLLTAILASLVIALFDESLEKMVALAVLMPIIASMGGNAGTQTLTIAVRSLATRELVQSNTRRVIFREVGVGLLNGLGFALVMGVIGYFWFKDGMLGVVVGVAMVVNLVAAGLAGILVPLGLQRAGKDPALASTVFVTTITDVVGFFAFLGLATCILLS